MFRDKEPYTFPPKVQDTIDYLKPQRCDQGRNHGIDIGGVQMWALPQIYFFKCISHNSQFSYIDKDLLI